MKQETMEYIKNHIKEYLTPDYQDAVIRLEKVTKGNDLELTGLTILKNGEIAAPSIYLELYDAELIGGKTLDAVMKDIAGLRMGKGIELPFDITSLQNYENARPRLSIRLCDPETNKEYLKDKPYTPCGVLAATYRIQVMDGDNGIAEAVITNNLLQIWGITKEQLHQDAIQTESVRNPVCFYRMEDVVGELTFAAECPNLFDSGESLGADTMPMYVLTNQNKMNGAGTLAWDGVLDKVGELIGSDFYILPSSIHELLILPEDGKVSISMMESMVKDVNATQVSGQDLLSDKVQYYDREAKTLGYKQEKGVLGQLKENKDRIQERDNKTPKVKGANKNEPSL